MSIIILIAIACVTIFGIFVFDDKYHAFISLAVTVLSLLLFLRGIQRRQIAARRMVIAAVMIALSVIGRFIPFFKPITALTTLSGMYIGSEAGFLVGALSAVISNFYFGQGPWTPFQMLAWGLIGYVAGILSKYLRKSKPLLMVYGVLSGIAFSLIMDLWTVLWYSGTLTLEMYASAILTAIPFTILYAVSNIIFIYKLAKPIGDKLTRINVKYGL